jgi:hypothetical protein
VFFRLIVNAQISFDERTAISFTKTRVGFSLPVSCAADDPSKHPFAQLLKKSGEREREREREREKGRWASLKVVQWQE